jgi:hypothetical protein
MPRQQFPRHRSLPARRRRMLARVIPQRVISIFFAASAQDAKSGSYAPVTALANGFAALLAVRLCGGSSNENGSGESASGKLGCNDARALAADHELIGRYFRRARPRLLIAL